jgi:hypothetical protein
VDALPLIHPTFSVFNLGLRDLSRVRKSINTDDDKGRRMAASRVENLYQGRGYREPNSLLRL